jgi:uncharacterized protein GlcG (DUF336 family)
MPKQYESLTLADAKRMIEAGKVVAFGGGVPVVIDEVVVGAVGAIAGKVEQDIAVVEAAISALLDSIQHR